MTRTDDNTNQGKLLIATVVDSNQQVPVSSIYYPPRYDRLRLCPLFNCLFDSQAAFQPLDPQIISSRYITENELDWSTAIHLTAPNALYTECQESSTSYYNTLTNDKKNKVDFLKNIHMYTANRIPRLSELCLRVVATACVVVTEAAALAGGLRADVPWMKVSVVVFWKKCNNFYFVITPILPSLGIFIAKVECFRQK